MALWGLRWHNDGRPDRWWEPEPQVKLWGFAASPRGAFVIVESDEKPHGDADLLSNLAAYVQSEEPNDAA